MENLLLDLVDHNLRGRRIALIESGSWALSAAKGMRGILSSLKETEFISEDISFLSSLSDKERYRIDELVDRIIESI